MKLMLLVTHISKRSTYLNYNILYHIEIKIFKYENKSKHVKNINKNNII